MDNAPTTTTTNTPAAVARAVEAIDARPLGGGRWAHHDHATGAWWVVEEGDMVALAEALAEGGEGGVGTTVSRWCADTDAVRMPGAWRPDMSGYAARIVDARLVRGAEVYLPAYKARGEDADELLADVVGHAIAEVEGSADYAAALGGRPAEGGVVRCDADDDAAVVRVEVFDARGEVVAAAGVRVDRYDDADDGDDDDDDEYEVEIRDPSTGSRWTDPWVDRLPTVDLEYVVESTCRRIEQFIGHVDFVDEPDDDARVVARVIVRDTRTGEIAWDAYVVDVGGDAHDDDDE